MHESSFLEMGRNLGRYLIPGEKVAVLDVGSMCVPESSEPRTYRDLMASGWAYTGCDIGAGPNVDIVMRTPERLPDGPWDVILCGQVLEHTLRPWRMVKEMARVLRPGGLVFLTAPTAWPLHPFPVDCWRFLPDGMRVLLGDAGLEVLEAYIVQSDCWAIGRKGQAHDID